MHYQFRASSKPLSQGCFDLVDCSCLRGSSALKMCCLFCQTQRLGFVVQRLGCLTGCRSGANSPARVFAVRPAHWRIPRAPFVFRYCCRGGGQSSGLVGLKAAFQSDGPTRSCLEVDWSARAKQQPGHEVAWPSRLHSRIQTSAALEADTTGVSCQSWETPILRGETRLETL